MKNSHGSTATLFVLIMLFKEYVTWRDLLLFISFHQIQVDLKVKCTLLTKNGKDHLKQTRVMLRYRWSLIESKSKEMNAKGKMLCQGVKALL
ncbi:MAG: hypothetical protein MRK01_10435 [Candidatus Scalindua sp.]|nr:hypothetical protein [Candidatus Scalindua sp.]